MYSAMKDEALESIEMDRESIRASLDQQNLGQDEKQKHGQSARQYHPGVSASKSRLPLVEKGRMTEYSKNPPQDKPIMSCCF